MKTKTKVFTLALCAVLLVVATVFTTVAFLTSQDSVNNTFTVGKVAIVLDESDVDGSKTNTTTEGRDKKNEYKLIPGKSYLKDPVIHVDEKSEDCWLFVELTNGLAGILADKTIEAQMAEKGWALVNGTTNIYARSSTSKAGDNVSVFDGFTVRGDVTDLSAYAGAEITVVAYAVQAEGFATAADAWAATFGKN